jgi:iron-sulfur cluster assembly accessory protein
VTVTERAARRIAEIAAADPNDHVLRISVEAGGCTGFQYKFDMIRAPEADDVVIRREGAVVVVDPVSLEFMGGAELDYVDELIGASFKIRNPNATAACGCGTSFTV